MKFQRALSIGVLICILAGGAGTFWYAQGNSTMQVVIGGMTSAAYVAWGMMHHAITGDLHRKIVIEYVLIGFVAVVLLATLAL